MDRGEVVHSYDSALMGILQNEGEIANFLDVFFGFLFRRTDFYLLMKQKTDSVGFPPGVALKLLVNTYKKYEELAKQATDHNQSKQKQTATDTHVNMKAELDELAKKQDVNDTKSPPVAEFEVMEVDPAKTAGDKSSESTHTAKVDTIAEKSDPQNSVESIPTDSSKGPSSEKDDTESQQKVFQANPESYNGAIRDNYSWSQSITDLDLRLNVPKYIKKGKEVTVCIQKKHIKAAYKDKDQNWQEIVNEDLTWEVNKEESIWSLVPGEHIHVNFEKKDERWWEAVLVDEPKINTQKIDASRPMSDLDDGAQSKIEEMMFNERQKRLGLPQTHESKAHDMLRKAWDAEGSPFKGQPFDPSKFTVDANSGMATINK